MKTSLVVVALGVSALTGSFAVGCSPLPNPVTQSPPKAGGTKKVEVSIESVKAGARITSSASFAVGPDATATYDVYWDGKTFTGKPDAGEAGASFLNYSPDLAFAEKPTAAFKIRKKISVSTAGTTSTLTTTETVTVKRGVPKKL